MEGQSPFAIANYFIQKSAEDKIPLTPMKLIKLVYIAHGWYLGLANKPLIREPVEAWKYGPVIESLYHAYKRYGNSPLPPEAGTTATIVDNQHQDVQRLLAKVWEKYSKFTAVQLSTITHQPNTPWSAVYDPNESHKIIPDAVIKEHYQSLVANARRRSAAAAAAAPA